MEFETKIEYVKALLQLEQCFVIAINSTGVGVEYEYLKTTQLPGMYLYLNEAFPDLPLVMSQGLLGEYNIQTRHHFYTITSNNYLRPRKFSHTVLRSKAGLSRGQLVGPDEGSYVRARFMDRLKKKKGVVTPLSFHCCYLGRCFNIVLW